MRRTGLRQDAIIILALFILALFFFWPVTLGGKTLLPADNAIAWEPWKTYADELGIGVPHNGLLSDLYLENYVWKRFIVKSLRDREIPLWNPYIFCGVPFLAAGQHSAMYPLSIVFYVLPIPMAYGWFAALHLFLAGLFTYILARTLGVRRTGSTLAALTFMFSGFMVIRNVFPMIIAAAVWLPLILSAIERAVRRAEYGERGVVGYLPDFVLGTLAFGMAFLAGHPEMYYYVSLTAGFYALWRLVGLGLIVRSWRPTLGVAATLLAMALLGLGLGCAQWLPLLQLVKHNFRTGGASFQEVLSWAYPRRRLISLFIPDFFGNPAHHTYFDLFTWRITPVTVNALGKRIDAIYWGIKNYVEGASYVGVLPLLLAGIAVLRRKGRHIGFFVLLAVLSLLFVFGCPLYILIYKLPGLDQVHSPFRWIYPYSLCIAILAGMGVDALWRQTKEEHLAVGQRLANRLADNILPWGALGAGLALVVGLALSLPVKERLVPLAESIMHSLALAPQAYADGRAFYSYEFRNLLILGVALLFSGLILVLRRRLAQGTAPGKVAIWGALAALVIVGELFVIGKPFFPSVDPALVAYRTPAIDFLASDPELYRITTYVEGSEKLFNANSGMMFDISDVRGYDSIIPRQYAEYMGLIQEQNELQYNRIAPIFQKSTEALDSPLFDMLNIKYVLTDKERTIHNEGYTLVYDDEIRIYRNEGAMPRVFLVREAISIPNAEERRQALRTINPREVVILEETVDHRPVRPERSDYAFRVEAIDYTPNEVTITVATGIPCFLVLGDTFFEDWLAFTRPYDAPDPALAEQKLYIYRANGNFRAVKLGPGRQVVRFKYSPNSVKFGLYISFLAGAVLLLSMGLWAWLRFRRGSSEEVMEQRVTKNTLAPIILSLVNKGIDMAFAMLMLRILGPVDAGQYALAIVVIGWFDIFTNFGLNTLLTREVARDKQHANRYLSNTIALRVILWLVAIPILFAFFGLRYATKPLEPATILALFLFGLALLPSNIAASFSAAFNAYERMEVPASVTTLTTLLKVSLGTVALIVGGGYVGLAGVSILVNIATMIVLYVLLRRTLFRPHIEIDWDFQRRMVHDSYPLMINLLLATLFFKIAMLLLEWLIPDGRVLGWYGAAYKYIDAVQIIPAYFTMAIFPLMSRYATNAKDSLLKAYRLAIKLLLIVAVPAALLGWALSDVLITILGGSQYLPYAAHVLQVMIWYMPLGFINSVTQYVLIALDQQRFLTRAFAIALTFNIVANLVLITKFGFVASAYVAIVSELALFIPFYVGIRRHLAHIPWFQMLWRQVLCSLPMVLMVILLPNSRLILATVVGLAVYVAGLILLRVFDSQERAVLGRVLSLEQVKGRIARALQR